ncbi:cation:proton antiporter [Hoyosella sp. YIM 151337]|uniref:cation:proton antiporter n=1 Tax=Hoyosella sp. YIM 151337 TaxID=2992742 RepID=UPI002235525F|nr:cation:proton antiporter [Hoyosella sp. YIM 151337]MCW4352923.1 cation:proton antiporter [Hoyosella sp. YIM 151337]
MSASLVIVLVIAGVIPLLIGAARIVLIPVALCEICAGIALGPFGLGWIEIDGTVRVVALLGLSFLLFVAGHEIDPRRFRGTLARHVAVSLLLSIGLALAAGAVFALLGIRGTPLLAVALLATSLGLIVPVLADAQQRTTSVGKITIAGASAGDITAVVLLSVGFAGTDAPLPGRVLLLALLALAITALGAAIAGLTHSRRVTAIIQRGADTSAQIRVRLTVLLVAGLAYVADAVGFEAILGAFLAGVLVRVLDPEPERTHPRYPVKLEALGFGFLIPVFFVASGAAIDVGSLLANSSALMRVPLFLAALLIVRGVPVVAYAGEVSRREAVAVALLQATSLPFLLTAAQIGREMDLIDGETAAALVLAGLVSVLLFPAAAVSLLRTVRLVPPPLLRSR